MRRLGDQLSRSDAALFAGRERETALFEEILGEHRASVVFVHGPGGIGKSTLLREVGRRGLARGYTVFAVDGRELAPLPGDLERALGGVESAERPLVLLDTYERVAALGSHLRTRVLPQLPATARVVIAGRLPPEDGWLQDGWQAITLAVPLAPLSPRDARTLLERRGVTDPAASEELVAWAGGSPLALALAADGITASGAAVRLAALDRDGALGGALVRRLVGDELDGADLEVVEIATVASGVDARLLTEVLPDVDAEHALAWLRTLSFTETLGRTVTLHDRVRRSLRSEMRVSDPVRERELRRRVAESLHARGRAGDLGRFLQFGDLVHDPTVRFGFGADAGRTHRADVVRDGDVDAAAAALGAAGTGWWAGIARWFAEAPRAVMTVRDAAGDLTGFTIVTTLADAPAWAEEDPVIAPVIAHARAAGDGAVLIRRDVYDLAAGREGDPRSPTLAVTNASFALRADLEAVRNQYCVNDALDRSSFAFNEAAGVAHLAELDRDVEGRALHYHLLDHGPGGVIETGRALVYRDLGLTPPPSPAVPEPVRPPDATTVRDLLRGFRDPLLLAASPLARGATPPERAAFLRTVVRDAVAAEFGPSSAERLLRGVLELGYLDPDGSHERAMLELHVSRATYFRRLTVATQRVTPRILEGCAAC